MQIFQTENLLKLKFYLGVFIMVSFSFLTLAFAGPARGPPQLQQESGVAGQDSARDVHASEKSLPPPQHAADGGQHAQDEPGLQDFHHGPAIPNPLKGEGEF